MIHENEIGLALSGGGAKCAFQVGALKALAQKELLPYITAVSGTSAGALNAALLINVSSIEEMEKIWTSFSLSDLIGLDIPKKQKKRFKHKNNTIDYSSNINSSIPKGTLIENRIHILLDDINKKHKNKKFSNKLKNVIVNMINRNGGIFSFKVLSKLIQKHICEGTFNSGIDCYITCYNNSINIEESTETFLINGQDGDCFHDDKKWTPYHIHNILLASIALPIIYPPVKINGKLYNDGGTDSFIDDIILKNPEHFEKGLANVPYGVLLDKKFKYLIVIDFEDDKAIQPKPGQKIIEIKLNYKKTLEKMKATTNFKENIISELIDKGYHDTLDFLSSDENANKIIEEITNAHNFPNIKKPKDYEWKIWNAKCNCVGIEEIADEIKKGTKEIIVKSDKKIFINALKWIFNSDNTDSQKLVATVINLRLFSSLGTAVIIGFDVFAVTAASILNPGLFIGAFVPGVMLTPVLYILYLLSRELGENIKDAVITYNCYDCYINGVKEQNKIALYKKEI